MERAEVRLVSPMIEPAQRVVGQRTTDRILAVLKDQPMTPAQLARRIGIDYSIVHATLSSLRRQGCVRQGACPHCGSKGPFVFVKSQKPAHRPIVT